MPALSMPKAELQFEGAKGAGPLTITIDPRDRRGVVTVTASQEGESAFLALTVPQWVTLITAILTVAVEKKP